MLPKLFTFLVLFSFAAATQAQSIQVSGQVTDATTGEPLPYATVSVSGKAIGTITNADGSFHLYMANADLSDSLIVSTLGYARIRMPLTQSLTDYVFKLNPQPFILDEVVVVSVDEIFKKIRAKVKDNYPVDRFQVESFYREIKKQEQTYRSLLEAALVLEDEGYDKQRTPLTAYVREIRGSSKFTNVYSDFWQINNLLRATLGLNAVRHPASDPSVFGRHPYSLKAMGRLHDRPVYILTSDTTNGEAWQRTIYVDTETYAIYRSEESLMKKTQLWKMDDNDSIQMRLSKGTSTFDFRMVNGRLYPNHIRHDVENEYVNRYTGKVVDHFTIINELVITDVHKGELIRNLPVMKNYALEQQVTPYNDAFWSTYNAIKQTPLEVKAMKDLTKEGSLKDQFIRSSTESQSTKKKKKEAKDQ